VAVYDYGRTPDGILYYAMEYLQGLTLESLVHHDGPQPPGRVVQLLTQASGALEEAHQVGLIHRDVKPANLMLTCRGSIPDFLKVLDFGLVKEFRNDHEPTLALTNTQTLLGTPTYMSPEAIEGRKVDGRSDLYALGAVGYFLLTGAPPFEGETVVQVCLQHLYEPVPPPSDRLGRELPQPLVDLLLRCLNKDPSDRPQSAGELREALTATGIGASWSTADAKRWWQERGSGFVARARREASRPPAPTSSRTLSVDFEGRTEADSGGPGPTHPEPQRRQGL
jgi:serine/threonine-protein kinase